MELRVSRWAALFGLTGGMLLLFCAGAYAQTPSKETELASRADGLHAQAIEKQSDTNTLSEAARLHLQEAELRPVFDVSAVDCITLAGNLFYAAKRPLDARRAFEQAADRALSLGDLQRSATLYLNASFAALREGATDEAQRLGRRADLLATSPLLSQAQREDLHRRWTHPAKAANTDRARMAFRADSLHQEALRMQEEPGRLVDAARLYKDEAKLRLRDDPSAVDNLVLAGHLLVLANRPLEARHTLEDAGDRALALGDVSRAALAFIEAAFVADKEGNGPETQRLGHRAEMLSVSELLTPEQRQEITRRIRRVPFA